MDIHDMLSDVKTKDDLIAFIGALAEDSRTNTEEWENITISDYISSIQAWLNDMDGYYKNSDGDMPADIDWNFIAVLLYTGKIYE